MATSGADTIPEIKRCIAAADEAYEAGYPGAEMLLSLIHIWNGDNF